VKEQVYLASSRRQNPFTYDNIVGRYYFVPKAAEPVNVPSADPALQAEIAYWSSIRDSKNPKLFAGYLERYPRGQFSEIAREFPGSVGGESTAPAPTPASIPSVVKHTGEVKVNPRDGLKYVWIPPGMFMLGCSTGDSECDGVERPTHEVTITKGFWLGQTEVTQAAHERVMGRNPSDFKEAVRPVESITWTQAQSYCRAIGGRLPTEAEWEYAARAGTLHASAANWTRLLGTSAIVGMKHMVSVRSSRMSGDCMTCEETYGSGWETGMIQIPTSRARARSTRPTAGQLRVLRGGCWHCNPVNVRVSDRRRIAPESRNSNFGLRCAEESH
jgi:formylglycine-generating enzyme required for sulfatase activity